MANYNVKLNVDTSQHDRALEKSAGQVNYYAKKVMGAKDALMGLTKKIPALALAVGGLTVAWKGVTSAMESVDSGGDALGRTLSQAQTIIDQFKISLMTANFEGFIKGLRDIKDGAKEAFDALDNLASLKLEADKSLALVQSQISEQIEIIYNQENSPEKREDAKKELKRLADIETDIYEQLATQSESTFTNNFISKMGNAISAESLKSKGIMPKGYDESDVMKLFMAELNNPNATAAGESIWKNGMDAIENYFRAQEQAVKNFHKNQVMQARMNPTDARTLELALQAQKTVEDGYENLYKQIEAMRNIAEDPNNTELADTKKELMDLSKAADNYRKLANDNTRRYDRYYARNTSDPNAIDWDGIRKTGLKVEASEVALIDSNEELKNEMHRIYNETGHLHTMDTNNTEDSFFKKQVAESNEGISSDVQDRESIIDNYEYYMEIAQQATESLNGAFIESFKQASNIFGSVASLGQTLGDMFDSEEVNEFFNAIQEGVNILNNMISVYESIASIIEFINTLKQSSVTLTRAQTAASAAATTANIAETSSESGKGIAAATASGAKLAFPYNLIAIALGVAAVVSALSLIGKFADGGIVGGATSVGDLNIARVNKGEMILNQREQSRLFNILSGVDSIGTSGSVSGDVQFRISGGDLIGVLNNQQKKKSRVL